VTGPFVHTSLLEFLFSIISYLPRACIVEKQIGTVKMAHRMITLGVFINTIFTFICGVGGLERQMSIGLWPLVFAEIVIECMESPDSARGLCCLPIQIPSKWYPVVLLLLFSLFFGIQLSFFVGLGVGYMHHFGLLNWADLGAAKATVWEERVPFRSVSSISSFVTAGGAMGGSILPTSAQRGAPREEGSVGTAIQTNSSNANVRTVTFLFLCFFFSCK